MIYTKKDAFWGGLLFFLSDTIAALLIDQFSYVRLFGMLFIGATLYAIEIPNYFTWLENYTSKKFEGTKKKIIKTIAVVAFFNPLWIFRHFVFIYILLGQFDSINYLLFNTALITFVINVPISLIGNYIIQNKIILYWRFLANAIFSGLLTIYYTLSPTLFG